MIWVGNKQDLSYYSGIDPDLCYCENIAAASDMYLQGFWSPSSTPYTASVEVWSVDGNTTLETVAAGNYSIYFGIHPFTGQHYFTFRLKAFTATMCSTKCFLIRIGIRNKQEALVFANWTERWCIADCCESANGITISQPGQIDYIYTTGQSGQPLAPCGHKLIRLITISDCYNAFDNTFYGKPKVVLSGSYFPFIKISTFQGRVIQKPRDISRQYSYNCRLQRVESARQYLLEGFEYFPMWKVDEIESQLSGNNIWVDDFLRYLRYEFGGGTPFKKVSENICDEVFKLETTLNDCVIRQIFGCDVTCDLSADSGTFFIVPIDYNGGLFYSASGLSIAQNVDGTGGSLVAWFTSLGLTAEVLILSPIPCAYTAIIKVTGDVGAVIPPSIYYDHPTLSNQINGLILDNTDNICDYIANSNCLPVDIGSITYDDVPCDVPVIGSITYDTIVADDVTITETNTWILDAPPDTAGSVYNGNAVIKIKGTKVVVATSGSDYTLSGDNIAIIGINGIPDVPKFFTIGDLSIMVDVDGMVSLNGLIAVVVDNEISVNFTITYNIT